MWVGNTTRANYREGDSKSRTSESASVVLRGHDYSVSSSKLVHKWSGEVQMTESRRLTFMADTSPSGEAKTCAGPFPPVLVDEIAPLKVPLSKMVKD